MKMLLVVIFALSCASTTNATLKTTESTVSTTSQPTESTTLSTPGPYPLNDYRPIDEIETCRFKYGTPAAKKQFPYVAFLNSRNEFRVKYCSGSLIHPKWVLTSAYCTLPDSTVTVTLGALVPFDDEDPDRVVVHSRDVFVHPEYVPLYKGHKNDVALIKLSRTVRSDAIIPIVLKRDSGPICKDNITFAAWGEVGYESLTFTTHILVSKGPCDCLDYDSKVKNVDAAVDSEFFCGSPGHYFCFIHNGAGLVINGVLVAVMSTRCFAHCRHHEGIFTNLYNHQEWIDNTMLSDAIPDYKVYGACSDITSILSGVSLIQPNNDIEPFEVFCDIRMDGEKWTVIQQRFNESVDFYRNYANYTDGFGPIDGNHWLGLEKIHQMGSQFLTKNGDHELLVELRGHNLTRGYAQYSTFKVDSTTEGFKLSISGYSGKAGDSMTYSQNLNGMKFSTFDNDQDTWSGNCAERHLGAWWYKSCMVSNLNGRYNNTAVSDDKSMFWYYNFGGYRALKTTRMLIRRK